MATTAHARSVVWVFRAIQTQTGKFKHRFWKYNCNTAKSNVVIVRKQKSRSQVSRRIHSGAVKMFYLDTALLKSSESALTPRYNQSRIRGSGSKKPKTYSIAYSLPNLLCCYVICYWLIITHNYKRYQIEIYRPNKALKKSKRTRKKSWRRHYSTPAHAQ